MPNALIAPGGVVDRRRRPLTPEDFELIQAYRGRPVSLDVLGPPPSTLETVGALAPLAGAAVMAPSLPAAMATIPAYHYLTSGAAQNLPSIPTMPGEPWTTLAELVTGAGGKGAGGEALAAPQWRPGMKLKDVREANIVVPHEGKKLLVGDVGKYLESRVRSTMGAVPRDAPSKTTLRRMLNLGRRELEDQLAQGETGLGWYDEDVAQATRNLGQVFPEIQPGSPSEQLWTAISSVLSPSSNPRQEAFNAGRVYEDFRNTGRIPIQQPSGKNWPSQGSRKALDKIQRMIDDLGEQGFIDFLNSPQTVADIRQYRPGTAGKATDVASLGSLVLGPKVGRYYGNRLGMGEGTTVDMWDTRKAGRQLGQLMDARGRIIDAPTEAQRDVYMDVHGRLGEEFGISPKDAQSAQWHYEQALYRLLGLPVKSFKLSEGTEKYLRSRGVTPERP